MHLFVCKLGSSFSLDEASTDAATLRALADEAKKNDRMNSVTGQPSKGTSGISSFMAEAKAVASKMASVIPDSINRKTLSPSTDNSPRQL